MVFQPIFLGPHLSIQTAPDFRAKEKSVFIRSLPNIHSFRASNSCPVMLAKCKKATLLGLLFLFLPILSAQSLRFCTVDFQKYVFTFVFGLGAFFFPALFQCLLETLGIKRYKNKKKTNSLNFYVLHCNTSKILLLELMHPYVMENALTLFFLGSISGISICVFAVGRGVMLWNIFMDTFSFETLRRLCTII